MTPDRRQAWLGLAALTLARAGMGLQFQAVAAMSPLVSAELGLDKTQLGWLIGLYLLPGVVISLPGGLLGARFGDKRMVLAGLGLMALGGIALSYAGSLPQAAAARLLAGAGAIVLNVLATKMVSDWFDGRERLLAMSVLVNAWPLGIGLALVLVGPLGQALGWRAGAVATTAWALVGFAAVAAVYRAPAVAATTAPAGLGLNVLSRREWTLLAVATLPWMLYNAGLQISMAFLPLFLTEQGRSLVQSGALAAAHMVAFVAGVQAGGVLLKNTRHPDRWCAVSVLVWCAALLLLAAGAEPFPLLIVGGLVGGLSAAAYVSLPAEFLRPQSRGAGMGVFYTLYYLGCALLPSLAGALYDRHGGRAALWMAAGTVLAVWPILLAYRRMLARTGSALGGGGHPG